MLNLNNFILSNKWFNYSNKIKENLSTDKGDNVPEEKIESRTNQIRKIIIFFKKDLFITGFIILAGLILSWYVGYKYGMQKCIYSSMGLGGSICADGEFDPAKPPESPEPIVDPNASNSDLKETIKLILESIAEIIKDYKK